MKTLKQQIREKIEKEVKNKWPDIYEKINFQVERPKEKRFGDYSSNIAMQLAGEIKENPIKIAKKLKNKIKWPAAVGKTIAAPPGFINFYLSEKWLKRQLARTVKNRKFGNSNIGENKKVQIEFISANPTGPLHVGNGRGAFTGDVLGNVLQRVGFRVQKEYYLNDMGRQVDILGESVRIRYFQKQGINLDFPEYGYKGKYIDDLASKMKRVDKYKLKNVEKVKERIRDRALKLMIKSIKNLISKKLKIKFNKWYSEKDLYKRGIVEKVFKILKEKNLLYKSKEAIYVKTTLYGDDKDRVLVKKNNQPTYFLSDIAYHYNKIEQRNFDKVIDIWGADHYGHKGRMQAMMRALGFEGCLDIIIYQLVRLIKNGKEVKMSKRSGTFVTLEELVDEVGNDVVRFFFLMYSADRHMDFDLNLAKERSQKNPVYYVQYAHARICSIMKKAQKLVRKKSAHNKKAIEEKAAFDLFKEILKFPEILEEIALSYEVNKLPLYVTGLATKFHNFYNKCQVIEDDQLNLKRYKLIKSTKFVLRKSLKIMGLSAPKTM
ncbi:MAG: arginine--tRNA ligase [Patescibacteria group bacterium]|nr:arginine--tRNA ligase [Patescibacteria group bacterium]